MKPPTKNPFQGLVSKALCDEKPETEGYLMSEAQRFVFEPTFNRAVKVQSRDLRLTSDAGFLLLREADQRLGLTASLVEKLRDPRRANMVRYKVLELFRERVYALAQGYRPTDDLDILAHDPALRLAAWDRPGARTLEERLASQPTQSRLTDTLANYPENREILRQALGNWVGRHALASAGGSALQRVTLDLDSFPIEVFGSQEGAEYHGYYDKKIYHPLVASLSHRGDFDSSRLGNGFVYARLRHGSVDSADEARSFLSEVIAVVRSFANALDVRFDAAFAEGENFNMLTALGVGFTGRLRNNAVLDRLAEPHLGRPQGRPPKEGYQEIIDLIPYQAQSWHYGYRVILVVIDEPDPKTGQLELFPRHFFLVTSWSSQERSAEEILAHYRRRGTFEDRIGEFRGAVLPNLSSPRFEENEVHLLVSLLSYNLASMIRGELEDTGPNGWDLGRVQKTVFKAGAQVLRSGRRLLVQLACAASVLWARVVRRIALWKLPGIYGPPPAPRRRPWRAPPRHAFLSVVYRE